MKNSTYLLLSLLFCCMSAFPKEITIHTIGDSTYGEQTRGYGK